MALLGATGKRKDVLALVVADAGLERNRGLSSHGNDWLVVLVEIGKIDQDFLLGSRLFGVFTSEQRCRRRGVVTGCIWVLLAVMVVMVRGRASRVAPALLNLLLLLWLGWDRAFDMVIEVAIEGRGATDGGQVVQRGSLELIKSIFNGESLRPNRC